MVLRRADMDIIKDVHVLFLRCLFYFFEIYDDRKRD